MSAFSSIVVSLIKKEEEWGLFVWNRLAEIRCLTYTKMWRHLPGTVNPVDLPSRGYSSKQLLKYRGCD